MPSIKKYVCYSQEPILQAHLQHCPVVKLSPCKLRWILIVSLIIVHQITLKAITTILFPTVIVLWTQLESI